MVMKSNIFQQKSAHLAVDHPFSASCIILPATLMQENSKIHSYNNQCIPKLTTDSLFAPDKEI